MRVQSLQQLYPLHFAVVPFVHIVASNPGQSRLITLGAIVFLLWTGFGLLYLLVHRLQRGRRSAHLTPLIVLAGVVCFYVNPSAQRVMENISGQSVSPLLPLFLELAVTTACLVWLARRPTARERVEAFLRTFAVLLLGFAVMRVGLNEFRSHRRIVNSKLAAELRVPIKVGRPQFSGRKPNIYLIVLDEYANSAVLKELFDTTNQQFEDSLRSLGFTIPQLVRSNYTQTTLSIPSLLNFAYLNDLTTEVGRRSNDRSLPNYLLENNRLVAFLKAQGYRFVFFPSQWWRATDRNRHADWEFQVKGDLSVRRALASSELAKLLSRYTLFATLGSLYPAYADYIEHTFGGLRVLETGNKPTFVFAHMIFPHGPYFFNARCERKVGPDLGTPDRRYLDQVRCANVLILDFLDAVLRRPGPTPVIVLQGDHGSGMLGYNLAHSPAEVTPAQARERLGAFGAYLLPYGGAQSFRDTVTVVNVFRKVLHHYFGAVVGAEEDHLYISVESSPFDLVELDQSSLR